MKTFLERKTLGIPQDMQPILIEGTYPKTQAFLDRPEVRALLEGTP